MYVLLKPTIVFTRRAAVDASVSEAILSGIKSAYTGHQNESFLGCGHKSSG